MVQEIIINGDDSPILSVRLEDILKCVEDRDEVSFGILWLDVTLEAESHYNIFQLEKEINRREGLRKLSFNELMQFSSHISQAINLLVVGDADPANVRNFATDKLTYANCEYVIELIDSSYWLIHSTDRGFQESLFERIPGVQSTD